MPEPRLNATTTASASDPAADDDAPRRAPGRNRDHREVRGDATREPVALTVTLRRPDGRPDAEWSFADTWSAMHQFSRVAARDFGERLGVGATAAVVGRDRRELATAVATSRNERELRFADPATQDLYRLANRERQMALSEAHLDNRITALGPNEPRRTARSDAGRQDEDDATSRGDRREDRAAAVDPRRSIDAFLEARDPPATAAQRDQRRQENDILDRADAKVIQRMAALAQAGDLDAVRRGIADIRRQVEAQVGLEPGNPGRKMVPPLDERFTRDEGFIHTNWWFRDAPDRLAFQERWLSLRTGGHSPAAIQAMVERAQENGWRRLFVEGSAEFRREAWIQATARDITVVGYTPTRGDREAVARERDAQAPAPTRDRETPTTGPQPAVRPPPAMRAQRERRPEPVDRSASSLNRDMELLLSKAFRDSSVPASLQAELRRAVAQELARRMERGDAARPTARVYDVRSPRSRTEDVTPPATERATTRSNRDRTR